MSENLAELERHFIQKLKDNKNGLSTSDIAQQTPTLTPEERVSLINRIIGSGDVEMCSIDGSNVTILRYHKSNLPIGASAEDQLVRFYCLAILLLFRCIR